MKMFKPLADYKNKTFIQNIVLKLHSACDRMIIVTGYRANEVEENVNELNLHSKIEFIFNPDYEKGMFTSLQKGISEVKTCDWILYHFVDQPGLQENFYPDLIKQTDSDYNWIQPVNKEQKGHPILLSKELIPLVLNAPINSNLRDISQNPKVKKKYWDCNYEEIFQDIDTDQDYRNL